MKIYLFVCFLSSQLILLAVSDDLLQRISQKVGGAWKDLGIHLLMAESDIQGAEDLAYGKSEAAKSQAEQDRITWETNPDHP